MPFRRLRLQLVAFLVGTTLRTIGGNRGPRHPVAPLPPGPVAGARRHYLLSSLLAASAVAGPPPTPPLPPLQPPRRLRRRAADDRAPRRAVVAFPRRPRRAPRTP